MCSGMELTSHTMMSVMPRVVVTLLVLCPALVCAWTVPSKLGPDYGTIDCNQGDLAVKRFCEEKRGTSNIPGPLLLLNKFPRFRNLVTASQYAPIDLDIGSRYAARDIDSASRYAARDIDSASRYGPREVDSAGQYDPREVDSAGQYDPRDVDITSQYISRDLDDARQYTPRLAPSGNAKVLRDSLYALNNDAFVDTLKAFDTMRDLYQKEAAGRSQHYDPYSR